MNVYLPIFSGDCFSHCLSIQECIQFKGKLQEECVKKMLKMAKNAGA